VHTTKSMYILKFTFVFFKSAALQYYVGLLEAYAYYTMYNNKSKYHRNHSMYITETSFHLSGLFNIFIPAR